MFALPDNLLQFANRCLQLAEAAPTEDIKTCLLAVARLAEQTKTVPG